MEGKVTSSNMMSTFNCGIGMIVAVSEEDIEVTSNFLNSRGMVNKVLGKIVESKGNKASIKIV